MTDYRRELEAWLSDKSLGDDTSRREFLDACLNAVNGDRYLQGDYGRQPLSQAKNKLGRLEKALGNFEKALDCVLDNPTARGHLEMAGCDNLAQLKVGSLAQLNESLNQAMASTTLPRGGQQLPVDVGIGFIGHAWKHYFAVKPSPTKGSRFHAFIDLLANLELIRTISETTLRRILS